MILKEFPNLQWLKQQADKNFADKKGWQGRSLQKEGWPNVILNVNTQKIYRDNIRGPLSIFTNISGESIVEADKRSVKIKEGFFFVTNQDQHYTLAIDHPHTQTFNIHFGEYFADHVFSSLSKNPDELLNHDCFTVPADRLHFFNKMHVRSDRFNKICSDIEKLENDNYLLMDEKLFEMMSLLFNDHHQVKKIERTLPGIKSTTRKEIIKRLYHATDFIYSSYDRQISLETLSRISCLSKFHFLRLFKLAFNQTPHQFINAVRIAKAKNLLKRSGLEVNSIGKLLGFKDASSFSRLFYNEVGVYPSSYR